MARPGIAATGMFQFFFAWNDYYGPLLYTSENHRALDRIARPGPVPHRHHAVDWNWSPAATLLVMAPVVIVFFFAQKAFVEGVTLTGVKG